MMKSNKQDTGERADVKQANPSKQANTMRPIKSAGKHGDVEQAGPPDRYT